MVNNMVGDYIQSIDSEDKNRKPPFSVGDVVVYRDFDDFKKFLSKERGQDNTPMIVLEYEIMDLSSEEEIKSIGHDYRFHYILLDGDEKISRFEERLKLYKKGTQDPVKK